MWGLPPPSQHVHKGDLHSGEKDRQWVAQRVEVPFPEPCAQKALGSVVVFIQYANPQHWPASRKALRASNQVSVWECTYSEGSKPHLHLSRRGVFFPLFPVLHNEDQVLASVPYHDNRLHKWPLILPPQTWSYLELGLWQLSAWHLRAFN